MVSLKALFYGTLNHTKIKSLMKNFIVICFLSFLTWSVGAQAVADFTYIQNDPYVTTVQFTNTSQNAIEYSWDFGDGTILPFFVNAENPSHTYNSAGTYQVCLTAKPFFGLNDQTCYDVTVICPQPTADFNISQSDNCTPEVQFTNDSEDYISLLWDFGDGNTSTDENPTHMYSSGGTYTISVIATNPCGSDTYAYYSLEVYDYNAPMTNTNENGFDYSFISAFFIQFEEEMDDGGINSFSMTYDFGDGDVSNSKNPVHAYSEIGIYTVCASATNSCGTSPTYCDDVFIGCVFPEASFTYNQSDAFPPTVDFTSTSIENDVLDQITYAWDFGDGQTSSDENPIHVYTSGGVYDVSLIIYNSCATDSYSTTIEVNTGLYVDASATGNNDGSSWENAYTDLQSALVLNGLTVYIAEGTYYPTSGTSRAVFFDIPTGTTLLGGYPMGGGTRDVDSYETILSGDINMDGLPQGNSFHVVRLQEVTLVTLDGITITGGNADNANSFARARGGGVYAVSTSNITIENCILEENEAIFGGAVFATLSPYFVIEESTIQSNTANNGSALYHSNETTMYIYKSRIIDNNSLIRCAIEINNSSHTHIENSVIANNASLNANAIGFIATNRDQTCEIYNSTILGETKNKYLITLQVGFNDVLDVEMYNTIVSHQNTSFNKTFKDYNNGTLQLSTNYCYIQGASVLGTANNNLYSDTDGDLILNADYSLSACSPGFNDGWNYVASILSSTTDIDGNPRMDGNIDIGAFESPFFCFRTMAEVEAEEESDLIWKTYPNPVADLVNIEVPISESIYEVRLVNSLGQVVQFNEIEAGMNRIDIELSHLPMGRYWIQLKNNENQYLKQINIVR